MASGLELGMALEMASICTAMVLEMVAGVVSELEIASEMPSERELIGHPCFEGIHAVGLAPLLIFY